MFKAVKILIFIIVLIAVLSTLYKLLDFNPSISKLSVFSWSSDEITTNRTELLNVLTEHEFNRIFQSFPSETPDQEINSFVLALTEKNIDVYALSGTPEWATDSTGKSMIQQLNRIVAINKTLPNQQKIKGLVIDVEPYLLDDFDWEDESIQKSFISGLKNLYEVAQKNRLELIVVVPYFYETKGYEKVLTTIIHEASTEVAVMNYYKGSEIKHIAFEAKEAKKAEKPMTTIYEFKSPGQHDLSEKNTYFYEGYDAALQNAKDLLKHYKDQPVHIAIHDYQAFKEVIQHD